MANAAPRPDASKWSVPESITHLYYAPVYQTLTREQRARLDDHRELLDSFGLECEDFGRDGFVRITAGTPAQTRRLLRAIREEL